MNTIELAKALSMEGQFNVTIMCAFDVDIEETPLIHKYPVYIEKENLFPSDLAKAMEKKNTSIAAIVLRDSIIRLTEYLFIENTTIVDDLAKMHFDLGFSGILTVESLLL